MSDKKLESRIYKEHLQLNIKKTNQFESEQRIIDISPKLLTNR